MVCCGRVCCEGCCRRSLSRTYHLRQQGAWHAVAARWLDFVLLGSSLSIRSYTCCGSSMSAYGALNLCS